MRFTDFASCFSSTSTRQTWKAEACLTYSHLMITMEAALAKRSVQSSDQFFRLMLLVWLSASPQLRKYGTFKSASETNKSLGRRLRRLLVKPACRAARRPVRFCCVHQNIARPFSWDSFACTLHSFNISDRGRLGSALALCGWCLVFSLVTHFFFFIPHTYCCRATELA